MPNILIIIYSCIYIFLLSLRIYGMASTTSILRSLIGSNCIKVSRGRYVEYYHCIDCTIEDAIACIHDMRHNVSMNLGIECNMLAMRDSYQSSQCCPRFEYDLSRKRLDLAKVGSAYPEALRCIANVGCTSSTVYTQLLTECESTCPSNLYKDTRDGGPICFADFNAASSLYSFSTRLISLLGLGIALFLLI